MVVSNIIQNIKFKEEKEVETHDKQTKVSVYRINLFETDINVSLGKVNYCIKKLIEKGSIKFSNFSNNPHKVGYAYLLTPKGLEEKARLTVTFLKIKMEEYEVLKQEISILKKDTEKLKTK